MGCMPSKRVGKHKSKLLNFSINPVSLRNYREKIKESLTDPIKLQFICRKFRIPEPEPKIFRLDLPKLYGFGIKGGEATGERMSIILKDFQNFTSSKSYFYTNIHYVCIPDFDLETGLSVFIIFCTVHNIQITVSQEYPFLDVISENSECGDLVRSWQECVGVMHKLFEDYKKFKFFLEVKGKTEGLIRKYEGESDEKGKKKFKYFKQLLEVFNEFIGELQEMVWRIRLFCESFEKNRGLFEDIVGVLKGCELRKCDNLIHLMF